MVFIQPHKGIIYNAILVTSRAFQRSLRTNPSMRMKPIPLFLVVLLLATLSACGGKSYYKTAEGRKKQRYYNAIQFGKDPNPVPPKSITPKKKKR